MSPADQNDGAVTEIDPSEDEKRSPEETAKEDANDEGAEDESAKPH